MEVAEREGLGRRELVIDLDRAFVGVDRIRRADFVEVVRQVRQGDVLVLNRLRRDIEARDRNEVAGERDAGQRVPGFDRRLREVAGALERRRHHRRVAIVRLFLTQSRIAREEERLVLRERAAERAAELFAIERIVGADRSRRRPARGVQLLVADEIEGGAVKHVRSGLRDDVDDARREAAVLRRVAVGQHAELLHRLRVRRRVARAAQAGRVVPAIQLEVDGAHLGGTGPVDHGHLLRPAERVRARVAADAARDAQELVQVAVDERQVQHLVLADRPRQGEADAVSTSGESPTTDTVSLTAPSSIVASTLALRPTSS